jgi:hypothetical protein
MENLKSFDDSSSLVWSSDLTKEEIAEFKTLAQTVASDQSAAGHCLVEVDEREFKVKQHRGKVSLDPLLGGGSVVVFLMTMILAADFTPIALILLVISFVMPDTSRLLAQAVLRKFKKPMKLDPAKVSMSSEKSLRVQKAAQYGFVPKYLLMPDNSLRVVVQLPEDSDTMFKMLE